MFFDVYGKSILTLILKSLALIVSLAWNDAIKEIIKTYMNIHPSIYPFIVTIIYLYLGKLIEKI
jgi:hypothetical protein